MKETINKNPPGLYSGIKAWTIPKQKKIRMKLNSKMINYASYPLVYFNLTLDTSQKNTNIRTDELYKLNYPAVKHVQEVQRCISC